jgi:hypothetical protein
MGSEPPAACGAPTGVIGGSSTVLCSAADSDDRAQPFRFDGAQRSDLIAISCGYSVDIGWVSFS